MIPMNIPANYPMKDFRRGLLHRSLSCRRISDRCLFARGVFLELWERGMENFCEHVTYSGEWGSLFLCPRFVSNLLTPSNKCRL